MTVNKKHIIIYSHGFGVRKDDNGLLSDIAEAMPEVESILFDYFEMDEDKKEMHICAFSEQVEQLNNVIRNTRAANPEAIIDLICHSQGTIVAAQAQPEGIRKTILLAPSFDMSLEHTLVRYRTRIGTEMNLDGVSRLPNSTGIMLIVPKEYWQERLAALPFVEYNTLAKKSDVIAIKANQDRLSSNVDLKELDSSIKMLSMDGDHNFNGDARKPLIDIIRKILL